MMMKGAANTQERHGCEALGVNPLLQQPEARRGAPPIADIRSSAAPAICKANAQRKQGIQRFR